MGSTKADILNIELEEVRKKIATQRAGLPINLSEEVLVTDPGDPSLVLIHSKNGARYWFNREGQLHRNNDLPAILSDSIQCWYKDGEMHRDGGKPSSITSSGLTSYWAKGHMLRSFDHIPQNRIHETLLEEARRSNQNMKNGTAFNHLNAVDEPYAWKSEVSKDEKVYNLIREKNTFSAFKAMKTRAIEAHPELFPPMQYLEDCFRVIFSTPENSWFECELIDGTKHRFNYKGEWVLTAHPDKVYKDNNLDKTILINPGSFARKILDNHPNLLDLVREGTLRPDPYDPELVILTTPSKGFYHWFNQEGELHRNNDLPALVGRSSREWYEKGKRRRSSGKATLISGTDSTYYEGVCKDFLQQDKRTTQYLVKGKLSSEREYLKHIAEQYYAKHPLASKPNPEQFHFKIDPSNPEYVIHTNGWCRIWLNREGQIHREGDLPAVVSHSGYRFWCKDGRLCREQDRVTHFPGKPEIWYIEGEEGKKDDAIRLEAFSHLGVAALTMSDGSTARFKQDLDEKGCYVAIRRVWSEGKNQENPVSTEEFDTSDLAGSIDHFPKEIKDLFNDGGSPSTTTTFYKVQIKDSSSLALMKKIRGKIMSRPEHEWFKKEMSWTVEWDKDDKSLVILSNRLGTFWFNQEGLLHRNNDLPAWDQKLGSRKLWYKNGKLHRDGGKPASVLESSYERGPHLEYWVNGVQVGTEEPMEFSSINTVAIKIQKNSPAFKGLLTLGRLERDTEDPSLAVLSMPGSGNCYYFNQEGLSHRNNDRPAWVETESKSWYINGVSHREGGKPSRIYTDGRVEYMVNGVGVAAPPETPDPSVDPRYIRLDGDERKEFLKKVASSHPNYLSTLKEGDYYKAAYHRLAVLPDGTVGKEPYFWMFYTKEGAKYFFNKEGQFHAPAGLPAIKDSKGGRTYYQEGKKHRDYGLPAVIPDTGNCEWWVDGVQVSKGLTEEEMLAQARVNMLKENNRLGGALVSNGAKFSISQTITGDDFIPVIKAYLESSTTGMPGGTHYFDLDGKRVAMMNGDPSSVYADGTLMWFKENKLHREGGLPAIIHSNGSKEYFIEGKRLSPRESTKVPTSFLSSPLVEATVSSGIKEVNRRLADGIPKAYTKLIPNATPEQEAFLSSFLASPVGISLLNLAEYGATTLADDHVGEGKGRELHDVAKRALEVGAYESLMTGALKCIGEPLGSLTSLWGGKLPFTTSSEDSQTTPVKAEIKATSKLRLDASQTEEEESTKSQSFSNISG